MLQLSCYLAVKVRKYIRYAFAAYAPAGIEHPQFQLPAPVFQDYTDGAFARRVLEGVGQQIAHNLMETGGIGVPAS